MRANLQYKLAKLLLILKTKYQVEDILPKLLIF